MKIKLLDNIMVTNPLFIVMKDINTTQIKIHTTMNELGWMEYTFIIENNPNTYLPGY